MRFLDFGQAMDRPTCIEKESKIIRSPDGRWLAFEEEGLMLVEVGQWVPIQVGPKNARPVDWLVAGAS